MISVIPAFAGVTGYLSYNPVVGLGFVPSKNRI
jgi:hypothetical protein